MSAGFRRARDDGQGDPNVTSSTGMDTPGPSRQLSGRDAAEAEFVITLSSTDDEDNSVDRVMPSPATSTTRGPDTTPSTTNHSPPPPNPPPSAPLILSFQNIFPSSRPVIRQPSVEPVLETQLITITDDEEDSSDDVLILEESNGAGSNLSSASHLHSKSPSSPKPGPSKAFPSKTRPLHSNSLRSKGNIPVIEIVNDSDSEDEDKAGSESQDIPATSNALHTASKEENREIMTLVEKKEELSLLEDTTRDGFIQFQTVASPTNDHSLEESEENQVNPAPMDHQPFFEEAESQEKNTLPLTENTFEAEAGISGTMESEDEQSQSLLRGNGENENSENVVESADNRTDELTDVIADADISHPTSSVPVEPCDQVTETSLLISENLVEEPSADETADVGANSTENLVEELSADETADVGANSIENLVEEPSADKTANVGANSTENLVEEPSAHKTANVGANSTENLVEEPSLSVNESTDGCQSPPDRENSLLEEDNCMDNSSKTCETEECSSALAGSDLQTVIAISQVSAEDEMNEVLGVSENLLAQVSEDDDANENMESVSSASGRECETETETETNESESSSRAEENEPQPEAPVTQTEAEVISSEHEVPSSTPASVSSTIQEAQMNSEKTAASSSQTREIMTEHEPNPVLLPVPVETSGSEEEEAVVVPLNSEKPVSLLNALCRYSGPKPLPVTFLPEELEVLFNFGLKNMKDTPAAQLGGAEGSESESEESDVDGDADEESVDEDEAAGVSGLLSARPPPSIQNSSGQNKKLAPKSKQDKIYEIEAELKIMKEDIENMEEMDMTDDEYNWVALEKKKVQYSSAVRFLLDFALRYNLKTTVKVNHSYNSSSLHPIKLARTIARSDYNHERGLVVPCLNAYLNSSDKTFVPELEDIEKLIRRRLLIIWRKSGQPPKRTLKQHEFSALALEFMDEIVQRVSHSKTQQGPDKLLRYLEMEGPRFLRENDDEDPAEMENNQALREALEKNDKERLVNTAASLDKFRQKKNKIMEAYFSKEDARDEEDSDSSVDTDEDAQPESMSSFEESEDDEDPVQEVVEDGAAEVEPAEELVEAEDQEEKDEEEELSENELLKRAMRKYYLEEDSSEELEEEDDEEDEEEDSDREYDEDEMSGDDENAWMKNVPKERRHLLRLFDPTDDNDEPPEKIPRMDEESDAATPQTNDRELLGEVPEVHEEPAAKICLSEERVPKIPESDEGPPTAKIRRADDERETVN